MCFFKLCFFLILSLNREDFSIPMGVCPVCLAKIACFLGENFSFSERSSKLLSAYDSVGLFFLSFF